MHTAGCAPWYYGCVVRTPLRNRRCPVRAFVNDPPRTCGDDGDLAVEGSPPLTWRRRSA